MHKACPPYVVIVASILNEDTLAPPFFLSRYVNYLWTRLRSVVRSLWAGACALRARALPLLQEGLLPALQVSGGCRPSLQEKEGI